MNLEAALKVLSILNTLEPVAAAAVIQFLNRLEGKSTDEILNQSDAIWADIIDTAKKS